MLTAIICGGGHIAIDSSKLVVKAATAPIRLIPKAGSVLASVVSGAAELREGNKIKEKAVLLKSINLNPDDRQSILKKVAAEVTLKKAKAIQDINSDNQELHDWQQASIIQTVKNKFMFNIDAETYKTPQQILGCVDALKILWVISKGQVSSNNTEKQEDEVIKQLIAIPTSYTLTVKSYTIVGKKVYSLIKIVLSDILGC
ncbi:hypothetical protein [Candidatus Tisiphia endosymbiont of Dascillus cervinus]|uniref:hypothetical protein n=1 Tax=Candidatus Tisiphia endosymbiont of Dascillus cervinus TaxID=3066253 RepID=UPI00312C7C1C